MKKTTIVAITLGLMLALYPIVALAGSYFSIRISDSHVLGETNGAPPPPTGYNTCLADDTTTDSIQSLRQSGFNVQWSGFTGPDPTTYACTGGTVSALPTPTPTATPLPNPTIALAAGAGTDASFSLAAGSNLQRGAILVTAGTSPSAGSILTVTFTSAPYIQIQAIGDNSILVIPYLRSLTSNVATIGTRSAMTAGQTYIVGYVLVP